MNDVFSNISKCFINDEDPYCYEECKTIVSAKIPTEEEIKEQIKTAIQNYDNNRLFSDDILMSLLTDKIEEELEKEKTELEKKIKRSKKKNIDNFIKTIKATYFVPHQGLTKVIWQDGTHTEVRCQDGDEYNPETGLALCIIKYLFGNINDYNEIFKYVFENKANFAKKDTSVKKKKKAVPKKRKSFRSQEKTDFEW